jgi:hypothetical protein
MGMKLCLEQRIYFFHSYEELEVKHKKAEERIKELSAQVRSADDNNNTAADNTEALEAQLELEKLANKNFLKEIKELEAVIEEKEKKLKEQQGVEQAQVQRKTSNEQSKIDKLRKDNERLLQKRRSNEKLVSESNALQTQVTKLKADNQLLLERCRDLQSTAEKKAEKETEPDEDRYSALLLKYNATFEEYKNQERTIENKS